MFLLAHSVEQRLLASGVLQSPVSQYGCQRLPRLPPTFMHHLSATAARSSPSRYVKSIVASYSSYVGTQVAQGAGKARRRRRWQHCGVGGGGGGGGSALAQRRGGGSVALANLCYLNWKDDVTRTRGADEQKPHGHLHHGRPNFHHGETHLRL